MNTRKAQRASDPRRWWARAFGGIFLGSAVTHLILLSTAPNSYDSFADGSWLAFVRHAWRSVLIPNVGSLIPVLITFEACVGLLILSRRYRRTGIAAAIAFNAALILFGWGFCIWSLPVIALLLWFWHLESVSGGEVSEPGVNATDAALSPAGQVGK